MPAQKRQYYKIVAASLFAPAYRSTTRVPLSYPLQPSHDGRRQLKVPPTRVPGSILRPAIPAPSAAGRPVLAENFGECLGQVPIVRMTRLGRLVSTRSCYLKLESCNPGGSIKEKNALCLVQEAERQGLLQPGGTIVESSSGNLGVGLAMVGAVKGYRVIMVIDQKTTAPFRRMLAARGAELEEVPASAADASGSMQRARMRRAENLAASIPGAWYPCQHLNPNNPDAHFEYTAREIDNAFGGDLQGLVVGVSTGGQLTGISRYLLPRYPDLKIVAADVVGLVHTGRASGALQNDRCGPGLSAA